MVPEGVNPAQGGNVTAIDLCSLFCFGVDVELT